MANFNIISKTKRLAQTINPFQQIGSWKSFIFLLIYGTRTRVYSNLLFNSSSPAKMLLKCFQWNSKLCFFLFWVLFQLNLMKIVPKLYLYPSLLSDNLIFICSFFFLFPFFIIFLFSGDRGIFLHGLNASSRRFRYLINVSSSLSGG